MTTLDTRVLAIPLIGCLALSIGCSAGGGNAFPASSEDTSAQDAGTEASSGPSSSGTGSGSGSGAAGGSGGSSGSAGSSGSGSSGGSNPGGPDTGADASSSGGSAGGNGDGGALWLPTPDAPIHFHWMIGGFKTADILPNQAGAVVYDVDGEGSSAADVAAIHAAGAIAVCYVDVGTLEQGRADYGQFPSSVVGPAVAGWPGENWLLVTAANQPVILPLMKARFASWCQAKGFDAIEADNVDGWTNISNITQTDNLAYDMAISQLAHALPLSIGLKNLATDLSASDLPKFVSAFDWALNEQCYEYSECDAYTQAGSFLPVGKAVFDVEYNQSPDCAQANQSHLNAQLTDLDLVGATSSGYKYTPCVPDNQATW
jgi:hypothetical protein